MQRWRTTPAWAAGEVKMDPDDLIHISMITQQGGGHEIQGALQGLSSALDSFRSRQIRQSGGKTGLCLLVISVSVGVGERRVALHLTLVENFGDAVSGRRDWLRLA